MMAKERNKINPETINKELTDLILDILNTTGKSGDGFGKYIRGFWDKESIQNLAEVIEKKIQEKYNLTEKGDEK